MENKRNFCFCVVLLVCLVLGGTSFADYETLVPLVINPEENLSFHAFAQADSTTLSDSDPHHAASVLDNIGQPDEYFVMADIADNMWGVYTDAAFIHLWSEVHTLIPDFTVYSEVSIENATFAIGSSGLYPSGTELTLVIETMNLSISSNAIDFTLSRGIDELISISDPGVDIMQYYVPIYAGEDLLLNLDYSTTSNNESLFWDVNFYVIPEPTSMALLGLAGLFLVRSRRSKD